MFNISNRLLELASKYVNKSLQPTYEELGLLVGNAMAHAIDFLTEHGVDSDLILHKTQNKDVYTLSYLHGFYSHSVDFYMYTYQGRYNQSEEWRVMVDLCWGLMHWSEVWMKNPTNIHHRQIAESAIRDTLVAIHAM